MSTVVAVTADPELRALVRECADRAGVWLHECDTVAAARTPLATADLVLYGADQVDAALRANVPRPPTVIVAATGSMNGWTVKVAELLHATYLTALPTAAEWLSDYLRRYAAATLERLRTAGFSVGFAHRDHAGLGYLQPLDFRDSADEYRPHPYVMLSDIARGECRSGQSTTVQRSNMRCLHRVFPGVFTDMVLSNVTALGAFVADLSPEVVDVLCRVATTYPLVDEDDHTALEHDEVRDSWSQWVGADVAAHLGPRARAVFDALDDSERERLWWDTVTGLDAWPVHDGRSVRWRLTWLTQAYAARLTAEHRRRTRRQHTAQAVT